MKKLVLSILVLCLIGADSLFACSAFVISEGENVFAGNNEEGILHAERAWL